MDLYILNNSLEKIGLIDNASSVIWTERYYEAGDFEIYIKASPEAINLLSVDNYVSRNDSEMVGVIENISIQTDVESGNYIKATGRDLKSILDRRIVWQQTVISGRFEDALAQLIRENVINPALTDRKISNFKLGAQFGISDTLKTQITGANLYEKIVELCKKIEVGWRIVLDGLDFELKFYKGENRSYNQSTNDFVVFSPNFDNLISTDYEDAKQNFKNVALIAGEGEGTARKKVTIGSASGLNRRELFVDANDISTNEGAISLSEYNLLLAARGEEKLAETVEAVSFSGEIDFTRTYILNQDYFLGDIVQTENEYGLTGTTRVIEVIEAEDESGKTIIPTFEEWR